MRDGVELFTIVYTPRDTSVTYPVILFRTPYSIAPYGPDEYREPLGPSAEFDRDGYIFVFQDVRGKFRSEGGFEVIRPLDRDAGAERVDESTDNFDTIEWVLANVPNHNGRVGQWGISYPGWQTVMGMVDPHPALVASSPQASPSDMFIGDDWHHNGAFRIMYSFSWLAGNARRRDQPTEQRSERFDYGTDDGYEFFLAAGTASRIDELFFGSEVPAWRDFIEHPTYDEFWQRQNALLYLDSIRHPVLNVAGWFDTEDFYGPMSIYQTIEDENAENQSTLVVGPWLHGGWRSMRGDALGCIEFESATSLAFQQEMQYPFFSRHLKDKGDWDAPEAVVFQTGQNEWKTFDRWPPAGVESTSLYLQADGRLSFESPDATDPVTGDTYVSDPANPVPFTAEKRTTLGHLWKVEDQRFVSDRPDVLVYQSDVLTEDLTIAGEILADIFVSTTGSDSDWIVKLIDVYPDDAPASDACEVPMGGFQMHLAGEIMRGRFRNSFQYPEAMVPGEVTPIHINLRDRFHSFKAGHRIMVQIQSSWFPAYDRNPQTFVDTYRANAADFQAATQTVYRSAKFPSRLTFGVLR
jgi:putative CocE/NonD family hydrolase